MYNLLQIKRFAENIFILPFILMGRLAAVIRPLNKEYRVFYFFPFYHTGGAEKVHVQIANATGGSDCIIFFTKRSVDARFLDEFKETGCEINDISKFTDNKWFYFLNLFYRGIISGYINGQMPHFVLDKIQNALNDHSKPLKGSRVHVLGVAYKRDIDDVRESPALDIIHLLDKRGAVVTYSDPFVPRLRADGILSSDLLAIDARRGATGADCVVIVTDHKNFNYSEIVECAPLIVDTRNALKGNQSKNIVRL